MMLLRMDHQEIIHATEPFGGSSVVVWGYISFDYKLKLNTKPETLDGQRYQQEVLDIAVVLHFANQPIADMSRLPN